MTVAAALLAAGGGTRFVGSSHKLLADYRGEPLLVHALRSALAAGFNDVYVVSGAVNLEPVLTEFAGQFRLLHNPHWESGQASSVQLAVAAAGDAGHSALVVGLGDQPEVGTAAWRTIGASRGSIVCATFDGQRRPPVKLDRSMWDLLPKTGDEGARAVMETHPELVAEVPCPGDPFDVDTVEDLQRAQFR